MSTALATASQPPDTAGLLSTFLWESNLGAHAPWMGRCQKARQQENQAVNQAASLVAFDRANHMGISDKSAEAI
eukprot:1153332-Pelagomonas_calceolata.AAC.1